MKKLYIILLILPLIGFGQGWETTFGGTDDGYGFSVQQTNDGGYIITGDIIYSYGSGVDVYLIKTNENGNEQWSQTFGGTNLDNGRSVQQTNDGGYIITGYTTSFGNGSRDVYLIKTDSSGNEQWTQTFGGSGGDYGHSIQQTNDGGYIITGYTTSFGNGNEDVFLIKTDENGNEQWSQTFGGNERDVGNSVQQTTDGGYIITGYTSQGIDSFGNDYLDVYLIKTDQNGEEEWSQTLGSTYSDRGNSVQQTNDGGYIITGDTFNISYENISVYLIKTDQNGEEEWSQTFGGEEVNFGKSGQQTTDGGYIITGYTNYFGNLENQQWWDGTNVLLIKTDENGNEEWLQLFGGTFSDKGRSVQQTNDGGYIITGHLETYRYGGGDVYLIKTDPQGNIISTIEIPQTSKRELIKTINILGQEKTTIKNQPLIEIYDDGSVEKKYIIE